MRHLALISVLILAACAPGRLAIVHATTQSREQAHADDDDCRRRAVAATYSAANVATGALLGATIVLYPVARQNDIAIERPIYQKCMRELGYVITDP